MSTGFIDGPNRNDTDGHTTPMPSTADATGLSVDGASKTKIGAREALLGQVAARYLYERLVEDSEHRRDTADSYRNSMGAVEVTGTARFIIDCLSPPQTAAIARSIQSDPDLAALFEIRLPRSFMVGMGLPDTMLTDERATYYRNAPSEKPALLLANTGDDEEQSLRDLSPVGAPDLQAHPALWVRIASAGLPITDEHRRWWEKALAGLQDLRFVSLDRYANYVLRTRQLIDTEGLPILNALGAALPALRLPKDTHYFSGLADRARAHPSKWRAMFGTAHTKRACFLSKQTPTGGVLSEDDLQGAFAKVQTSIPEAAHTVVKAFVGAPGGWTTASAALAECEWEHVKPLFDGLKREKYNLGQATLDFYGERDPELLTVAEREYLQRLISRKTTEAEFDDDKQFYNGHRDELREDRKLKAAWDRFLFGAPRETRDFFAGLVACLEGFTWDPRATHRTLTISCERRFKKDLRDLNAEAGLYFACRYQGLRSLFGRDVTWDVGELFNFPALVETWRNTSQPLNNSSAKSALQLKFLVELQVEMADGATERYPTQFLWRYDPEWVPCEFANDWARLAEHPLVFCRADREPTNAKGATHSIDLWNVRTLMAVYGQDRGSFVGTYKRANDIAQTWRDNLKQAAVNGWVTTAAADRLAASFMQFADAYDAAVKDFLTEGLASASFEAQLSAYGALLEALCREAKGDRARQLLLRPVLQIGTVSIEGSRPTAIVAPWHPLRMAAMARKARRLADLVRHLLLTPEVDFGDPRLFFRDLEEEFRHPYYPEVVLGWAGEKAELLALADVAGDYSLHECPIASDSGTDETNENPTEGASRVVELVQRYVALQPHEQANLSVVLYNSDSSRLPMAVVDKLGALHESDEDVRCQVVLRHRDARQLRALYEQIVEASDNDGDAFVASETTRDFMARLRIGIMADQAPPPDPRDGCPEDIVFSQDVIARHAHLEWYAVGARPADATLNPARWSRRRPAATGDMKSVVYLCCPVQRAEGWAFLTAVATFLKGDWDGGTGSRLLPARQLDFQTPTTARIFEETHNLGTWVVNYDELLDRRQLVEQGVRVIRYKQSATQGRNLIISSRAPLGLLRSMVLSRLRDLDLGLSEADLLRLAEQFITDANDISGDIVLRAAKRGRSASELIGLVLSRYLVRHELGPEHYAGWYFLDDYADWLGQREEQLADLMALSTMTTADGARRLIVVVSEAKYVDASSVAAKRKESHKQLRDTIRRLGGVVLSHGHAVPASSEPEHPPRGQAPSPPSHLPHSKLRLDRDVWLARLSDLLVDGVRFPAGASIDLPEWRRAIRDDTCAIELRGYSHVFVSGPTNAPDLSACVRLAAASDDGIADTYQEVFGRDHVRELVLRYFRGEDSTSVRRASGGDGWGGPDARRPHAPPSLLSGVGTALRPLALSATLSGTSGVARMARDGTDVLPPDAGGSKRGAKLAEAAPVPGNDHVRDTGASTTDVHSERKDRNGSSTPVDNRWAYGTVVQWLKDGTDCAEESSADVFWLRQVEATAKAALQQFQLQAKLIRSVLTPNAALLKFQGSAQLTVDQVLRRRSEFLTTHGLNLIGVQPEPGVIALSIARPHRETVPLRALWQRWTPNARDGNQELLIGVREADGDLLVLSPGQAHAPHTLIAGSTGSGKSVLMQNIILSIAATNRPEQARIILIDPKQGVDYFAFEGLPHLDGGIIDRQEDARARIEALVAEMDTRYTRLRQARTPNLRAHNERVAPEERIPTLWLIHDEFAEWMLADEYKEHVTSAVGRLGVKARAAGIHLVFAAQRPEANVMPMQLRANLGNRLILRVDSEGTSEIALGDKGAERLLGRGHLLAKLEGAQELVYAQVPFAAPHDLDELVGAIRGEGKVQ
jgi:S-DNA-T family DNA segregation ATPase FtsK/SpoIIIE